MVRNLVGDNLGHTERRDAGFRRYRVTHHAFKRDRRRAFWTMPDIVYSANTPGPSSGVTETSITAPETGRPDQSVSTPETRIEPFERKAIGAKISVVRVRK